uniref:Lipocalin n=1 Tax=Argas monolakensis TaxID=34602 RepID=Q09JU9_ARGMO|nr:lipocalin [Argas monolakensis]
MAAILLLFTSLLLPLRTLGTDSAQNCSEKEGLAANRDAWTFLNETTTSYLVYRNFRNDSKYGNEEKCVKGMRTAINESDHWANMNMFFGNVSTPRFNVTFTATYNSTLQYYDNLTADASGIISYFMAQMAAARQSSQQTQASQQSASAAAGSAATSPQVPPMPFPILYFDPGRCAIVGVPHHVNETNNATMACEVWKPEGTADTQDECCDSSFQKLCGGDNYTIYEDCTSTTNAA